MTIHQARERAARLGLSAWVVQAVEIGPYGQRLTQLMCVGFASAGLPLAEAVTWEEALTEAARIAFSA